ncbi:MAG: ATP-binding protein [Bacteroidota bacterium]|nr:ATP-binding protein [Bacteroidota bacterium]
MRIEIPNKVSSNDIGLNKLVNIYHRTEGLVFDKVTFDFAKCKWFEANLSAVFGAICNNLELGMNTVEFININPQIEKVLSKNEFLKHFGGELVADHFQTTIKYRRYQSNEQNLFKEYLDRELLSKEEMPKMSKFLQKKINESIFEIFENAITHGYSKHVFSCGQYYPNKTPPRIDFTIVDLGKTIKTNVNNYLEETKSAKDAIIWAVDNQNTTKTGNTPGGLGLKLIRKFLSYNKGEVQIVSGNGFWQQDKNNTIFAKELDNKFVGTIVNLEFNIDDNLSYITDEEAQINDEDIF